jgi:hypothetical protein
VESGVRGLGDFGPWYLVCELVWSTSEKISTVRDVFDSGMLNTGGGKDGWKKEIIWIYFIHVVVGAWIVSIHSEVWKCREISGNGMGKVVNSL